MQSLPMLGRYFFPASVVVIGVFKGVLLTTVPWVQYFFVFDFLYLYLLTVEAHLLGRLYYNNQRKLAWFD